MCGIVGYVGNQKAASHHPRGPEAPGIPRLRLRRASPSLQDGGDRGRQEGRPGRGPGRGGGPAHRLTGTDGIGHTRWATHGGVTDANAHPHVSSDGKFALIHNGVIENYGQIKDFLLGKGYTFKSETDTEVLCNLIAYHYAKEPRGEQRPEPLPRERPQGAPPCRGHLRDRRPLRRPSRRDRRGPQGLAAHPRGRRRRVHPRERRLGPDQPDPERRLPEGRRAGPHHRPATSRSARSTRPTSRRSSTRSPGRSRTPSIDGYAHFMEKEIFEQPQALENTMRGRFSEDGSTAQFGGLNLTPAEIRQVDRFMFCACGTAWHACLVAEHLIERFARLPVEVDYASEFRYRNAPLDPQHALLRHQPVGRDDRHPGRPARGQAQGLPGPGHQQRRRLHDRPRGRRRHLPARRARRSASPRPRRSPPSSCSAPWSPSTSPGCAT